MLCGINTGFWAEPVRKKALLELAGIRSVHAYAEVTSTNHIASRLGAEGCPSGTLVISDRQTAGRGRLDRHWHSPEGQLFFSIVWRFPWHAIRAPQITLEVATAIARSFAGQWDIQPTVKWPNDVLFHGRKCCGVLTELRTTGAEIDFVVVGVGINLQPVGPNAPPELLDTATSLSEVVGYSISPTDTLYPVLSAMNAGRDYLLEQGRFDRRGWMDFANIGTAVCVRPPGKETFKGQVAGVTEDGLLQVKTVSGQIVTVIAGDVSEERGMS